MKRLVCVLIAMALCISLCPPNSAKAYIGNEMMSSGDADVVDAIILNLSDYAIRVVENEADIVLDVSDPLSLFLDTQVDAVLSSIPVYGPQLSMLYSYSKMTAEALWELGGALAKVGSARRDLMCASFDLAADHQHALISCVNYAYQTGMHDYAAGTMRTDAQIRNSFALDSSTAETVRMLRKNASHVVFTFDQKSARRIESTATALERLSKSVPNVVDAYHMGYDVAEALAAVDSVAEVSPENEQTARLEEIYTEIFPTDDPTNNPSYFTRNGKACTHAANSAGSCTNCSLAEVLKGLYERDREKFGAAYELFDSGNMGGKTCVGFQRFVWLYVYEEKVWENSNYVFQKKNSSYNYFSQLQPGDAVDFFYPGTNTRAHAAIFLGCSESTVTFLDCNWTDGGKYGVSNIRIRERCYNAYDKYEISARRASRTTDSGTSQTISLDPTYLTIPVGAGFDFTLGQAMETSANFKDLIWTSSNAKIATVNGGKIIGQTAGKVTITVKTSGGATDSVTINVVEPEYNCAEKWTCTSVQIGPRTSYSGDAGRSARYSDGHYVIKRGAGIDVLAKAVDTTGNTWGFGAGYSSYLGQNIWGWFNLVDKSLGSEKFDFSYAPSSPTVSVQKTADGMATVSWTDADKATCYNLYQNGTLIRAGITARTAEIVLASGASAEFYVEAVNENFPYNHLCTCAATTKPVAFVMSVCKHPADKQTVRDTAAATCTSPGYTGDTYCNECGEKIGSGKVVAALDCLCAEFHDLDSAQWYHKAVDYVLNYGYMNGSGNGLFSPKDKMSRAMLVQLLYNMEGRPATTIQSSYNDVAHGAWYANAVQWADKSGLVKGDGHGKFNPDQTITREQLAVILYRYAQYKGLDVSVRSDLTQFPDGTTTSSWATEGMSWAIAVRLINGFGDGQIAPSGTADRSQAAQIIMNLCIGAAQWGEVE